MGKILFWNTAGAGGGDEGDEIAPTLAAYSSQANPDCVVICEMRKVDTVTKQGFGFGDYLYVKPGRPQQTTPKTVAFYHTVHDKRLYVYSKNPGVQAWQFTTGTRRPAVLLLVQGTYIMVMHAPSVSSTSGPQADVMTQAYDLAANLVAAPEAIFGDLNVDLKSRARVRSLKRHLTGHALRTWRREGTGEYTHKSKSELDWALCAPTFAGWVEVVNLSRKRRRKINDDDDWRGEDEIANKSSDHLPILLRW
jgi:hypothetical protein